MKIRSQFLLFFLLYNLIVFNTYRNKPFIPQTQDTKSTKIQSISENGFVYLLDDISECDDDECDISEPTFDFDLERVTTHIKAELSNKSATLKNTNSKLYLLYCSLKIAC